MSHFSKFLSYKNLLTALEANQTNGGIVKTLALKLSLIAFVVCFGVLAFPAGAIAADECSKELLLDYFPKQFVQETLKKFNVPQDKWDAITSSLAAKDKDVVKIVEDKASKLTPNPLKDRDPQQRQIAVKLFRETLLQVFSDALQANGVTDQKQLQGMLDDIQQQKAKNFAMCMEKQKGAAMQQQQQPQQAPDEAEPQPAGEAPEARADSDADADPVADNDKSSDNDEGESDNDSDSKEGKA